MQSVLFHFVNRLVHSIVLTIKFSYTGWVDDPAYTIAVSQNIRKRIVLFPREKLITMRAKVRLYSRGLCVKSLNKIIALGDA